VVEIVSATWKWYLANIKKLLSIGGIMVTAQIVIAILALAIVMSAGFMGSGFSLTGAAIGTILAVIILGIAMIFLSLWMTVALYTFVIANDPTMTVKSAYLAAREKIGAYFSTSIWVGLLVGLGFLLLIVPGIYWGVLYSLAPLIILVEGPGVRAMSRSKELIKGYWFDVLIRYIILCITTYILQLIIQTVFVQLGNSLGHIYSPLSVVSNFSGYISSLFVAPIQIIFTYQLYQNLKQIKG
jgi:hypothetical protein